MPKAGLGLDSVFENKELIDFSWPHNPLNTRHTRRSCTKVVQIRGGKNRSQQSCLSNKIRSQIAVLGELRPGALSQQYNICGNPSCRCKATPPLKHGPVLSNQFYLEGEEYYPVCPRRRCARGAAAITTGDRTTKIFGRVTIENGSRTCISYRRYIPA